MKATTHIDTDTRFDKRKKKQTVHSIFTTGHGILVAFENHDHIPIPGICEHVTLHGKWVLTDVINIKDVEMEDYTVLPKKAQSIPGTLRQGEHFQARMNQRDGHLEGITWPLLTCWGMWVDYRGQKSENILHLSPQEGMQTN